MLLAQHKKVGASSLLVPFFSFFTSPTRRGRNADTFLSGGFSLKNCIFSHYCYFLSCVFDTFVVVKNVTFARCCNLVRDCVLTAGYDVSEEVQGMLQREH